MLVINRIKFGNVSVRVIRLYCMYCNIVHNKNKYGYQKEKNMGEAAVKSHMKSKKHIDAVKGKLINCFLASSYTFDNRSNGMGSIGADFIDFLCK